MGHRRDQGACNSSGRRPRERSWGSKGWMDILNKQAGTLSTAESVSFINQDKNTTHISIRLIEKRWGKSTNDGHNKHHTSDTCTLRIKLLLLPPQCTTTHAHTRHKQNARK